MTYYRLSFWDIAGIMLTKGLWLLWIIWRDEKIEIPEEPK